MKTSIDKERAAQWAEAAKTKSVEWAYPTSPDAVRFGHGKTGCYVVNIGNKGVSAHKSKNDAIVAARALPNAWCPMYLAIGGVTEPLQNT